MEDVKTESFEDLYLIDASAPFFLEEEEEGKTNWSKIDFSELEEDGKVRKRTRREVLERFSAYVRTVRGIGYNAVSLDDLAHLVKFGFYPKELKRKLKGYRKLYEGLFEVCAQEGMRIFLNTDLMFHMAGLESVIVPGKSTTEQVIQQLCTGLTKTFDRYPEIEGVIFRLGEADGIDVEGDFKSRLLILHPDTGNRLLRSLFEVFKQYRRKMIVRTWTIGAYRVGDLMWNETTFDRLFRGLEDPLFYVSMKYGNADFFKYIELNPLFLRGGHQKLIELQARREYEGFGRLPNYVGFDYGGYRDQLRDSPLLRGALVWCQTGGWSHFRNITFVRDSSIWNELNTYACLKLFRDGWSPEEAVLGFCRELHPELDDHGVVELVKDVNRVVERLWYLPEYSSQALYFRRIRIPPLLWVFWDTILINHTLRKVLRRLVHDREAAIEDGYLQLETVRDIGERGAALGLDPEEFEFQRDTFEILAIAREYFLASDHRPAAERLERYVPAYEERHPGGFHVELSFSPWRVRRCALKLAFRVLLRKTPAYRWVDRAALNFLARALFPVLHRLHLRKRLPEIAETQAMGISVIFR